jgi:hypothetical protein
MSCYKTTLCPRDAFLRFSHPAAARIHLTTRRIAYFFEGLGLMTLSGNLRNKSAI